MKVELLYLFLLANFLIVVVFVIERLMTISKATGNGNIAEFIRKVQYHLANKNVDQAIAECDRQKGSVGNVMKAGSAQVQRNDHRY